MTGEVLHVGVDKLPAGVSERLGQVIGTSEPLVAPALAISVWQSGAPCFEASAGWIDPAVGRDPVSRETLFDLASLTKVFTATAFLRLVSDGRVGLDDPAVSVLPELAANGPRGVDGGQEPLSRRMLPVPPERAGWLVDPGEVTFRQLLTHTSGLAPWRAVFREAGPVTPPPGQRDPLPAEERTRAGLAAVFGSPFVARPGMEVNYSDLGFMTLGLALSRLARRPLDIAMRTLISDRLGLGSLRYAPGAGGVPASRIAPTSFDADWRRRRCWGEVEDENAAALGGVAGHAGLFAAASDVARFGVAWLRRDPRLRLGRLFGEAVSDQTPGMAAARGLGWQVQPADYLAPLSDDAFGHTGFTGTSIVVDPRRDLVIAILSNRVFEGRQHEGVEELRQEIHRILAAPAATTARPS